jgi:hypothetical protein
MIPRSSLLVADIGNGSVAIACFKSARITALSASSRSTLTIYKEPSARCRVVISSRVTTALGSRRDRAGGAPQLIVRPVIIQDP